MEPRQPAALEHRREGGPRGAAPMPPQDPCPFQVCKTGGGEVEGGRKSLPVVLMEDEWQSQRLGHLVSGRPRRPFPTSLAWGRMQQAPRKCLLNNE